MLHIQPPSQPPHAPHPILNLGFRIFFSGGALFAIVTMLLWSFVFTGKTALNATEINPFYWHAHEMLYGYAMAIVAGFLLTAVKTWTGVMMPYGYRLAGIFAFWAVARMCWMLIGLGVGSLDLWLAVAALADLLFMLCSAGAVIHAVIAVKQYKQMGIISKLVLLSIGNALCYWGIISADQDYQRIGVYLGLYLIMGIVLTIGRRVVPFFIERGLSHDSDKPVTVKNSNLLDSLSLLSFLIFMLADVFYPNPYLITITATMVALVNGVRLAGWHQPQLWQKPLLWSLFIAFLGMCLSFVLFAIQPWMNFAHSIPVHALALSGIGLMTVAMMARVSLGHTGRSIHAPPATVTAIFVLMVLAFVFRVVMPLIAIDQYMTWIMIAQTAWIACFTLFCVSYLPILAKPRTDGLFG
ncbi:NnrS family protein [Psychrobacter sp. FDAARGOS_221]|uniref:NnrS family protein n=1 Tax=Psychrobacter sp. FDAARGOS_221 TaxID=1975705 RepID=UPI000BB54B40|nr:NnrS family protein [Psychrobacter sp. FDAARGOS_221]PNK61537.1 NnrS family protein [Psychrobacter sp. FDAARGOS_221]